MTKIKEKLLVASEDEDALKVLEQFGLTKDLIEGFDELEKPATLDEAIRNFNLQSDLDKKLDKAIKTREENLKAKYDFVEKEQTPDKKEPEAKDPAIKALLDELKEIKEWRKEQEEAKKVQTIEQKKAAAAERLKSENIPGIYVSILDLDKDLDEQLPAIKERFTKEFPEATKSKGFKLPNPTKGDDLNKPSKQDEESFANSF